MDFPLKLDSAPSLTSVLTPTNVAILASLGVHAFVIGLALPSLQGSASDKESKGQVGVVQLTDAEQSRLPDVSSFSSNTSSSVLPDANTFPPTTTSNTPANTTAIPSNNPALNLPTSNPPLPSSDYNYNALKGQLPNNSSLPPLPSLPSLPPSYPSYPNLPGGYSGIPSYPSNYGNLSRFPVTAPPYPSISSSSSLPRRPALPGNPINTGNGGNSNLINPTRPRFDQLSPPKGTDFITRASQGTNLTGTENTTTPILPNDEPALVAQGQDTPSVEALRNDLQWRAKYGNYTSSDIAIVNLVGSYPRIACRNRTEASVVYNVDPNGSATPVSLSRYPIFNALAQQAFQSQRFVKPTRVTVNFQYDPSVCSSVATTNPTAPTINTPSVDSPGIVPPRPILPSETVKSVNPNGMQNIPELPSVSPLGTTTTNPNSNIPATQPNLPNRVNTQTENQKRPLLSPATVKANPPVLPDNTPIAPRAIPSVVPSVPVAVPKAPETTVKPSLPPIPKAPNSNTPLPENRPSVSPRSSEVPETTVKTNPLPRNLPSVSAPKPEVVVPSPKITKESKPEMLSRPTPGTNLLDNLRSRIFNSNPAPENKPTPAVKPPTSQTKPAEVPQASETPSTSPVAPPISGKK